MFLDNQKTAKLVQNKILAICTFPTKYGIQQHSESRK